MFANSFQKDRSMLCLQNDQDDNTFCFLSQNKLTNSSVSP